MREISSNGKILFWISCIVVAELTAFALLQKSVDSSKNSALYIGIAMLLFGIVVPLAFRETLKGNKIAISNLYWIIASQIGAVLLGYFAYKQTLSSREYVAVGLLLLSAIVQFSG
jgi:multidrug transporter EmrE-like cation transporter